MTRMFSNTKIDKLTGKYSYNGIYSNDGEQTVPTFSMQMELTNKV